MKFKSINVNGDYLYLVRTKQESKKITEKLTSLGFSPPSVPFCNIDTDGSNRWEYLGQMGRDRFWFYNSNYLANKTILNSFEEWCEKCIEGYVKEPIKTNPFKVGDRVRFVKVSNDIYRYSSKYANEDGLVIGEIYTVSKCETTEEWGSRISVEESPNKYLIGEDCFELYQGETPKTNNPIQETKGYTKVGNKHIFEEGYTGEHPFKVGQVVLIHEGCNVGSKESKGVIKEVNPKFASNRLLIHTDKLQDGSGRYSQSYPDKFENRRLIVTILSEQETKPSITHIESKNNKELKEILNSYNDSSEIIVKTYNWEDIVDNLAKIPKKKDKKDLSLLKEPNEIKIVVKTKNKKHKPNLSIIKN